MKTTEISVGGMTCGGCEQSIKRALERIGGVLAVQASHGDGRVVVDADDEVEVAELERAIEDAGYEVIPPGRTTLPLRG